ncbi:MAG: tRNA (guanosine(37)-N1)-methyltransferase TrmD [Candidatus Pacebacteria bacterium]|nr:tRNA (guanosine(37)-N1)-methyltransferase TrmD [Candidatus Paceibacterota bacterium]
MSVTKKVKKTKNSNRVHFHVITIFPEVCKAYTDASVLGRAQKTEKGKGAKVRGKKIEVSYYNPRDFATDKHKKVDERPYGGGPGMVMLAEPILKAWQKAVGKKTGAIKNGKVKTLMMSPRGKVFTNELAKEWAKDYEHLVLISGRYEGIDARVKEILKAEEVSVGDYVLTGGELPALTIIDSVSRQVPGVLGTFESLEDERATSGVTYTRPEVLVYKKKKHPVPEVLMNGNHAQIEKWRESK